MTKVLRRVIGGVLIAVGLYAGGAAASLYPTPNFSQVIAGLTAGGTSAPLPAKMNADADGVTGHIVVDSGSTSSVTATLGEQNTAAGGNGPSVPVACDSSAPINISTSTTTTTRLNTPNAGQNTYLCGFTFVVSGTSATVQIESGSGAVCGGGTIVVSGVFPVGTYSFGNGYGYLDKTTPLNTAICLITTGASTSVQGMISYTEF